MPTPIEVLLDPLFVTIVAGYLACALWERLRPARALPPARLWALRGATSFVVYFLVATYLPLLWDTTLAQYRLFDLRWLGTGGGALVSLFVYELVAYGWHRAMHSSTRLWRWVHQMHHSAERIDVFGSYYFSVFDMIGWTTVGSLVFALLIGVTPEAATASLLTITFLATFQHMNVRTPRWLGYLVQRPESHSVHHQRGVHSGNFADLPVFDIVFGTFVNPEDFRDDVGFYDGASARVLDMHRGRDVSEPPERADHPNPVRGRINAAFFRLADGYMHLKYADAKRALFGDLPNTVVEIGSGAGANFRYMRPGTRVLAVEPNPHMHAALRRSAERWGVQLEIVDADEHTLQLDTDSASAVVCSLVLCTVEDPAAMIAEVRRILEPGGHFMCLEHVAAPADTFVGRVQRRVFRPWRWFFEGCHTHRQTDGLLAKAGFRDVDVRRFSLSSVFVPVRPHIVARCAN